MFEAPESILRHGHGGGTVFRRIERTHELPSTGRKLAAAHLQGVDLREWTAVAGTYTPQSWSTNDVKSVFVRKKNMQKKEKKKEQVQSLQTVRLIRDRERYGWRM